MSQSNSSSIEHKPPLRHRAVQALIVLVFLAALAGVCTLIHVSAENDRSAAIARKRDAAHLAATQAAGKISTVLDFVYSSIRTIAKLPSVRTIDRHATNLSDNDRIAIQEIYNNLYSHLRVSEIYIVPAEFDPEAIDPKTGKPEEPIIMFDDNIVGKTGEHADKRGAPSATEAADVPEIEIYEYRELKKQMTTLKYSAADTAQAGQTIPAVISREVVTCDNSRYQPQKPNDKDRSGIIYSVPFYGNDGKLRGTVSAIILTHVLADKLNDGAFALYDPGSNYLVLSSLVEKELAASIPAIKQAKPDPALQYSEVIPVSYHDAGQGMFLWSGLPNTALTTSAEIKSIQNFEYFGYALTGIVGFVLVGAFTIYRRQRLIELRNIVRERRMLQHVDKAKDEFLANISNELRRPMRTALAQINLCLQQAANENLAAMQKQLGQAYLAAWRMLQLINDLLDISELESGHVVMAIKQGDLDKAVADACTTQQPHMAQRRLRTEIIANEGKPQIVKFDQKWLTHVFTHLLSNATRYAPVGSVITIRRQWVKHEGAPVVRCSISNQGPAISDTALEKIFDKFFRVSEAKINKPTEENGGTGLGLAICRQVLELHHGRIWAENTPPQGVMFTVELPLSA